ncbi:PNK3P-domain-containing protein [Terfezia boudieri ATCC MYA-4762]|uniref:PNK3P-domain-containing protein n=1 Tax=Terfezia boudieri ATCC MYA-4762 TaxID=1051890 RepID=A0A3N4MJK6_9PEZI|nr:PNK3P-domain-containing protein [Terfezia boudieri ATCC MYA-4762]
MSNKRRAGNISPPPLKRKVLSTTTSATVANFFKPLSQKEPEKTTWRIVDKSLLVANYDNKTIPTYSTPRKIAAFDLDSTLIKTSSGATFAKSESDWMWWDPVVPTKLKELHSEGRVYNVTIFTNQGGIKLDKPGPKLNIFKLKVSAILSALDIPLTLYGATENDKYRKPRSGMWDKMVDDYGTDIHGLNKEESLLVGDAAGRDGDFSASDRYFAFNVGIKFHTPEEYFLGHQPKPVKDVFNPTELATPTVPASAISTKFSKINDPEVVILVGSPGAGKSTFVKRYLAPLGYQRVNQDTLKTREKCLKTAVEFLGVKKSVVVDATNPDIDTRKRWIGLAKKCAIPIRCVYLTAPPHICQHNDAVRAFGGDIVNPENRKILPRLAFTGYASRFKEPTLDEGFLDITKLEFEWEGSETERNIWAKYWS